MGWRTHNKTPYTTPMKHFKSLIIALLAALTMTACAEGPETPDVSFAYSTYSYTEGYDGCYVAVYQMESPYQWPVEVTLRGEVIEGKSNTGAEFGWADIVEFEIDDEQPEYTVRNIDNKTFEISGVKVTYSEYNKKIFFKSKPNDSCRARPSASNSPSRLSVAPPSVAATPQP